MEQLRDKTENYEGYMDKITEVDLKSRMRENCTSGSVRGRHGNVTSLLDHNCILFSVRDAKTARRKGLRAVNSLYRTPCFEAVTINAYRVNVRYTKAIRWFHVLESRELLVRQS